MLAKHELDVIVLPTGDSWAAAQRGVKNRFWGLSGPAGHCRRAEAGGRGLDVLDLRQHRRQPLCQARRRSLSLLWANVRGLVTCTVRIALKSLIADGSALDLLKRCKS